MDKTGRNGLRFGDTQLQTFKEKYNHLKEKHIGMLGDFDYKTILEEFEPKWFEALDYLKKITLIDSEQYINNAMREGKSILARRCSRYYA